MEHSNQQSTSQFCTFLIDETPSIEKLIEIIPDGVVIVDGEGTMVKANSQILTLFGYSLTDLLGNKIELLLPDNLREKHTHYRENYISFPRSRPMGTNLSITALTKDGQVKSVDISLNPIKLNEQFYILAFIRDISEIVRAYEETLAGWSRAMDYRDKETENHTQRVTLMTVQIAKAIGMSETEITQARRGALLHDIGKIAIPDEILLKPDRLTPAEWEIMKKHPGYAYEMLWPIEFLRPALDIPYCHHEKWDGTGYPRGLRGEKIPLAARIFAVVDVWDALNSDRPYRRRWLADRICEYIRLQSGTHFDPAIVRIFLELVCID